MILGEVIVGLGGTPVANLVDLLELLGRLEPGVTVRLSVVRGEETVEIDALADGWLRARGSAPRRYGDVDVAMAALEEWHRPGDAILVKASNSSGLGRLAARVVERKGGGGGTS